MNGTFSKIGDFMRGNFRDLDISQVNVLWSTTWVVECPCTSHADSTAFHAKSSARVLFFEEKIGNRVIETLLMTPIKAFCKTYNAQKLINSAKVQYHRKHVYEKNIICYSNTISHLYIKKCI